MKKPILFLFLILGAFCYRLEIERRYFDPSKIPREKTAFRLLLLHRQGLGEKESAERIKTAAGRLGWECYSVSSRVSYWKNLALSHPLEKAIAAVKPDLTLNFQTAEKYAPGINFVSLSSGIQTYQGSWERYAHFDGFLPTFHEIDFLQERIESLGKPFHGMRWFFTAPSTPFALLPLKLRLFYCGTNWDRTRRGEAYKELFSYLDERDDFSIYGPKNAWKHTPHSYRGLLPIDGKSIVEAMQASGIVLVLHSETHLKGNSPTARIFEAAAASSVIISDSHPFVMQEFGDSILYVDQEAPPKAILRQIEDHLTWIRSHPAKAQEMAKRSHQIFEEKFSLEKQLMKLKEVYEEVRSPSSFHQ